MAPSWSKDSKEFNEQSKKAPVGFFGCDDRGYLYINGHKIPEHFAGFGRGNVVGVELDYSIPSKPAVFISVDGMRTAAIRRELVEGLIPCVILTGQGHSVKLNVGRAQRGKGILVTKTDLKRGVWNIAEDEEDQAGDDDGEEDKKKKKEEVSESDLATIAEINYDVGLDNYNVTQIVETETGPAEEKNVIYEGWNSGFSTKVAGSRTREYLDKFKAFNTFIDPKRTRTLCIERRTRCRASSATG